MDCLFPPVTGSKIALVIPRLSGSRCRAGRGTLRAGGGAAEAMRTCCQTPIHTYMPDGHKHRLTNPGTSLCVMIEVQCGDYVSEDDIVRFEDAYGRVTEVA